MHVTNAFPEWVEPMAATLTQERFTGPEWIFERTLDGEVGPRTFTPRTMAGRIAASGDLWSDMRRRRRSLRRPMEQLRRI